MAPGCGTPIKGVPSILYSFHTLRGLTCTMGRPRIVAPGPAMGATRRHQFNVGSEFAVVARWPRRWHLCRLFDVRQFELCRATRASLGSVSISNYLEGLFCNRVI